jgi:hypothetical protein
MIILQSMMKVYSIKSLKRFQLKEILRKKYTKRIMVMEQSVILNMIFITLIIQRNWNSYFKTLCPQCLKKIKKKKRFIKK